MIFYIITIVIIIFTYLYFKYFTDKNNQIKSDNLPPKNPEKLEVNKKNEKNNKNLEKNNKVKEDLKEEEEEQGIELTYSELLDKFCDYVQKNKVVNIDALSQKFGTTKEETIKKLREMEKEGQTIGFVDSNGEYFFLTMKEIELLDNLFSGKKKKKFSKEELEKLFNEICSPTGNEYIK